eukprot:TRINITY_DN2351_c0_g4_i1.p1 TRINITY_DN2351_c0_g4~~TRINITY_DN2351_c0_g4_i1.p1  ORF type:complete len:1203 (+),score=448.51 TRINITY_DN2351_c0_g4_i1:66-3674(+)
MGAGSSIDAKQVQQWEGALDELDQICRQQRTAIEQGTQKRSPARSPRGVGINTGRGSVGQGLPSPAGKGLQTPREREHTGDQVDTGSRARRSSILKSEAEVKRIEEKRRSLQSMGRASIAGGSDCEGALSNSVSRMERLGRRSSSVCFTGGRPQAEVDAAAAMHATYSSEPAAKVLTPRGLALTPPQPPDASLEMVEVDGKLEHRGETRRHNRQEMLRVRKLRKEFFASYMEDEIDRSSSIQCGYLGNLCAGLSYLLASRADGNLAPKNRVTVEDIFFTCHLPLHYIVNPHISLAELYDIAKEFIDHDPRFRDQVRVEVCHMDPVLFHGEVEQGDCANETGDRGPPSLATFRKTLEEDMAGLNAIEIFSFDPFIVEQSKLHVDDTDESDEDEEDGKQEQVKEFNGQVSGPGSGTNDTAPTHTLANQCLAVYKSQSTPSTKFGQRNRGWFSLGIEYNTAQHMVQLADAVIDTDVHLTLNDAPLTALYRACCARDRYTRRMRGFIRLSLANKSKPLREEEELESRELFAPDLYLGKGPLGIPLSSVDSAISVHIVAFAYATHLIQGMRTEESGTGVSCKEICKTMEFPLAVTVQFSMTMVQAHAYYSAYLAKTGLSEKIYTVCQPIEKKVDTEEAPPTMSIMDFENVLIQVTERSPDSEQPTCLMLLCFEVGCAHNMLSLSQTPDHYGVLMSYDQDKQMVAVLDVKPKKYTRVWYTSLIRLHKSLVGRGYILLYRRDVEDEEGLGEINMGRQDTMIRNKLQRITLPITVSNEYVRAFEFPPKVMCVTALAVVFNKLGQYCMVKDVVNAIDCDPSFVVSDHVSIRDVGRIANNFLSNHGWRDLFSVEVVNFDTRLDGTPRVTVEQLRELLKENHNGKDFELLVQCERGVLNQSGGGVGGEYCLVVDYDEQADRVVVADVNPQIYFRHIQIPVTRLHDGLSKRDSLSLRPRGYIKVSRKPMRPSFRYDVGRCLNMLGMPSAHPFKVPQAPHLSAIAFALSALGHPCSAEEVFYTAFTCLAGERFRRGSAIFPWQQLKISIHDLKERMTVGAVAKMVSKYEEAHGQNLRGDTVVSQTREEFKSTVREGTQTEGAPFLVMVVYKTAAVHDMKLSEEDANWETGCGLVKHYDEEADVVTVADSNPTRYGDFWTCSLEQLYDAADLISGDKEDNGLVKIKEGKRVSNAGQEEEAHEAVGTGFTAFGEAAF